jgi:hypothetical protein
MAATSPSSDSIVGMGLTAVILGAVAAALFFLPVLSIPLAVVGVAFGFVGFLMAGVGRRSSLRWSVVGVLVSGVALAMAVAIARAPQGYLGNPTTPTVGQSGPQQSYVPPPAPPGIWGRQLSPRG